MNYMKNTETNILDIVISSLKISNKDYILTVASHNKDDVVFDIIGGKVGHTANYETYVKNLLNGYNTTFSMIVREFTNIKVAIFLENGRRVWIPIKNLYGCSFTNNICTPVQANRLELYFKPQSPLVKYVKFKTFNFHNTGENV